MKKSIIILVNILLVVILSSCGNQKTTNSNDIYQSSEEVILGSASKENYYDSYFESIVGKYNEQLNWSILMVDVESQEILGQYGDADKFFEPGNIIKPIIYASLIEYENIDLDSMVDNSPITYGSNEYRSMNIYEPSSTVLDSFKSLSNTAIVRLWESAQKNSVFSDSIIKYELMPEENNLSSLFGYQTSVSLKECVKIYSELIKKDTGIWSQNTKDTIDSILSHTFKEITPFETSTNWTPYGVYETVAYPEKTGIDTNFAGYLTLEGKGIILVINVHDENDNFYMAKDLSEVVANIFYSYISQSYFTPIDDIYDLPDLESTYIYWGRPSCLMCHTVENTLFKNEIVKKAYYVNTDLWRNHPEFKNLIETYSIEKVPCITYQKDGILKKMYFDSSEDDSLYDEQIKTFFQN